MGVDHRQAGPGGPGPEDVGSTVIPLTVSGGRVEIRQHTPGRILIAHGGPFRVLPKVTREERF